MPQDILFALRSLRRQPGFFAVAVVTLALGIASTTAVFSLFYQVLLRTLPVPAPQELVVLHQQGFNIPGGTSSDNSASVFSYPMYLGLRDGLKQWQGLAVRSSAGTVVLIDGANEYSRVEVVSGNFFETLRLRPHIGRLLGPNDDTIRGGNPVAVISHAYHQKRFGGDPAVVGKKVSINGQPFEIVGVAQDGFRGVLSGDSRDFYLPVSMRAALTPGWDSYDRPSSRWLNIIGRLPAGQADAGPELQQVFSAIARDHVAQARVTNPNIRKRLEAAVISARPAADGLNELKRQWKNPLYVLLGMVGLLLLIACANLANLLLARGVNRAREISIRLSLGASRAQVIGLLFAETSIVTLLGASIGAAAVPLLVNALVRTVSEDSMEGWLDTALNLPVLGFTVFLSVVCALLAGLTPAWKISRPFPGELSGRSQTGTPLHARSRKFFVAAQLALSLVLVAVAGLFGRSFANLLQFNPGFNVEHVSTFTLNPGTFGYDPQRGVALVRAIRARLQSMPGVTSVAIADAGPMEGSTSSSNIQLEGYRSGPEENMDVLVIAAGPAFFETLGTPVTAGRGIGENDRMGAPKVAVVNQAFLKRFMKPGETAVGRHISMGAGNVPLDIEIVGVAADVKHQSLRETVGPAVWLAYEQTLGNQPRMNRAQFYLRGAAAPSAAAIKAIVSESDPQIPISNQRTFAQALEGSMATDRLIARLTAAFGTLALVITAIGLYGVLSYLTRRRTKEIGVRMALGATRGDILGLVMREVLLLVGAGASVGLLAALGAGRAIEAQLFGVKGMDPLVLMVAPALLALVALAAASMPSLRAAAVQPSEALRDE